MTYRQKRGSTLFMLFPSAALWAAIPVVMIALGVRRSDSGLIAGGVTFAALSIAMLAYVFWLLKTMATEVVISDDEVTAHRFFGRPTAFRWNEIDEIEKHRFMRGSDMIGYVSVTAHDGRRIAFDPRIGRFKELLEALTERAPRARHTVKPDRRHSGGLARWWVLVAGGGVFLALGVGVFMLAEGKTAAGVICLVLVPVGVGEVIYMRRRFRNRHANAS